MNIDDLREKFPILKQQVHGNQLVYFDNAATTQKPHVVIDAITEYYRKYNANIHRGVHFLSSHCTDAAENARKKVQEFINAEHSHEVVFTRGTTEAINLLAFSFGETFLHEGDAIVVTRMEHHSNIVPWQMLCDRKKATLKVVDIDANGELDLASYAASLTEEVKLAAFTHVSNTLGSINPVNEMIAMAHAQNIPVMVDGAQAIQHMEVDVQALDADFYVFSGHKMYGPTGIGVLYGKEALLEQLVPWQGGGEMIDNVSFEKTTYNNLPFKFEAGTPNYIAQIALGEAIDFIESIGIDNIYDHEMSLLNYCTEKLSGIEGLKIIGTSEFKSSVVSMSIDGVHPYDIGVLLDKTGIAVRTGNHCTQPLHDWYKLNGTLRVSFGIYNTKEEIDYFVEKLNKVLNMFK